MVWKSYKYVGGDGCQLQMFGHATIVIICACCLTGPPDDNQDFRIHLDQPMQDIRLREIVDRAVMNTVLEACLPVAPLRLRFAMRPLPPASLLLLLPADQMYD